MSEQDVKSDTIKRKGGRKPLYKEEYCQKLIDHLTQGFTIDTFGGEINVTRKTVYEWFDKYPDFAEAKDIGVAKSQKFYEQRLVAKLSGATDQLKKQGINTKDIDTSCLIFALKTRFHKTFSEKVEHKHDGNINITIDNQDSDL